MSSRILFTDKDHAWTIPKMSFDFSGVTNPLEMARVIYSSKDEWSWLEVDEILKRTSDYEYKDERLHKDFYEITECLRTLETLYKLFELYLMGGSHIGNHKIDLTNEVKAVETAKTWIRYANELHRLTGVKERLELTDKLVMKIARECKPTIFQMPNNERCYDDKKSVITFLSPYEDNTNALKTHEKAKNMKWGKNKIQKFLKGELIPYNVGGY